jgi:hypothetical protein
VLSSVKADDPVITEASCRMREYWMPRLRGA